MAVTLEEFHKLNRQRCEECFRPLDEWSANDYVAASVGELGELANLLKKVHRAGLDADWVKNANRYDLTPELDRNGLQLNGSLLRFNLGEEIADTIIYLDLLAHRLGIDLPSVMVDKFNEVTAKMGGKTMLPREE